jgi:hypothetical protein
VFTESEIGSAKKWFIEFCVAYLSKYQQSTDKIEQDNVISGKIIIQYGKFRGFMPPFDNIHELIDKTSSSMEYTHKHTSTIDGVASQTTDPETPLPTFDPKIIWNYYIDEARELTT